MKFLLGTKEYMTQVFGEDGKVRAVTVLKATPATVLQVKTKEKDGYTAIQFGSGVKSAKNITKPEMGHFKNLGTFRTLREMRTEDTTGADVGTTVDVTTFAPGDTVVVSAISKAKGFQGVVKRHGFHGGSRTHGQKHSEREPGSIGIGGVQRVPKGRRMAGRMGGDRVTVKNLKVVQVNQAENLLLVSGAIPGRRGTVVEIRG